MDDYVKKVDECKAFFERNLPWIPDVCIELGTGLGEMEEAMDVCWSSLYEDIPHFPVSTSPSHHGKLIVGNIKTAKVALFQGRFHYYEGYSLKEVAFPIRVFSCLGAKMLIAINAAGGLNLSFSSGDLMVIKDHINLIPDNPLRGENREEWGIRFPDLSRAYTEELRQRLFKIAERLGIRLKQGVFVAIPGPSLETPAETRFLRMIGADAVAMSLVPEVIVAVHGGLKVVGISVIANVNDPDKFKPILIEDVISGAQKAQEKLQRLLIDFIKDYFS